MRRSERLVERLRERQVEPVLYTIGRKGAAYLRFRDRDIEHEWSGFSEAPKYTDAREVGDVLGVVDGDFVEIGDDVTAVATRVAARLLAPGGELLTVVLGAEAPAGLAEALTTWARRLPGAVEVQVLDGGQPRYPVLLGAE